VADVVWTDLAERDLREIGAYIALDSQAYALAFIGRIERAVARLATFPLSGRIVPEFPEGPFREVIFQNYRIIYVVEENTVGVLRVRHAAMDLTRVLEQTPWNLA
jgi:plasmid stabilization system protein ParE